MDRSPTAERRAWRLAAAAVCLAVLAGCGPRQPERNLRSVPEPATLAPREGAGPVWEWDELPAGHLRYRALHPFIAGKSKPGRRVFVFRPFFSHEDEGPGSTRWKFRALWPLLLVQRTDKAHRVRVFPFVWERKRVNQHLGRQEEDKDFWILPFLLTGSDTNEGKYFALWPAGGMVKGIFGKQYIRFVLWPLWVEGHDKHYHSWNVPWPIFGVWKGKHQRGWRLWPLFGTNQRDGKFKRVFFLWPLGHYWRTGLDTDAPGLVFAIMPFYGKIENKHLRYVTVLWPFFARKHNKQMGFVEWHYPWPIFSRTTGKGIRGLKVFPFYEHRFAPNNSMRSFGWKLYERRTTTSPSKKTTTKSSLYIFKHIRDEWVEVKRGGKTVRMAPPADLRSARLAAERAGRNPDIAGRKERPATGGERKSRVSSLLWPLYRYRRSSRGEKYFTVLEPWWWRSSEIWDRHYGPFFTLYRYERFADGSVRERALFNLYEHSRSPLDRRVRFSPLVDYWRRGKPAEYRRFRILGGLYSYERRGKDKRVRILWIPIGRRPKGWR